MFWLQEHIYHIKYVHMSIYKTHLVGGNRKWCHWLIKVDQNKPETASMINSITCLKRPLKKKTKNCFSRLIMA